MSEILAKSLEVLANDDTKSGNIESASDLRHAATKVRELDVAMGDLKLAAAKKDAAIARHGHHDAETRAAVLQWFNATERAKAAMAAVQESALAAWAAEGVSIQ